MKNFAIAVVGATGMVGRKMLEILEEHKLTYAANYYFFASEKSEGKKLRFNGRDYTVIRLSEENINKYKSDIALFSCGGGNGKIFAPMFVRTGATVIDNSSAWRQDPAVPLVVPEVNPEDIKWHGGIIANPNCSTIQAVVALKPLHDLFKIKRIIYSTYQAVSGAGMTGFSDLENGVKGVAPKKFPHPIFNNVIPQIDDFSEGGYTKEELKMIFETKKILHDQTLKITATTVRVPVFNSHSESINVEFFKPVSLDKIKSALGRAKGVVLTDGDDISKYPMPIYANGKDEVFVGRVRIDDTVENGINMWVTADNIRKGAATNAVQIAELLIKA
jgi:aspartate-semialdehyde dehydrogenase